MAAPTNTTYATAIAMAAPPYATTQTVDDAGTTYTVWYTYTESERDRLIGLFGFGDLAVYRPTVDGFTAVPPGSSFVNVQNKAIQFEINVGETVWFRFTPNAGNPTPAVLTLSMVEASDDEIPDGTIAVNDDTAGFPLVLASSVDGAIVGARLGFPAGEAADILPDGTLLVADAWNGNLQLYDRAFVLLKTIAFDIGFNTSLRAHRGLNRFYAAAYPTLKSFSAAGVLLSTVTLTGGSSFNRGIAVNNAGSVLYSADSATSAAIARWSLPSGAATTNLAAGVIAYVAGVDILVLPDDSVLVSYTHNVTGEFYVRRYTAGGVVLRDYPIAATSLLPAFTYPRLATAIDTASFWVYYHLDGADEGTARFAQIRLSDGTVLAEADVMEYETGAYRGAETATPTARFGISFSCPFWITRGKKLQEHPTEPCCPCDCPPETKNGTPADAPIDSATGPILPPPLATWTPDCIGGGDVPGAADLTDAESWVS